MKKKFLAAFAICIGIMNTTAFAMEKTDVNLFFCGKETKLENPIYIEKDDYFVPLRECAEQIDSTVNYIPNNKIVIDCPNGRNIEYDFSSPVLKVTINDVVHHGSNIININGVSYINANEFYNHLGYDVSIISDYGIKGIRVGSQIKNIGISENDFQLLNVIQKNQNGAVSPISIKLSLAMVANGTTGQTKQQILKALGYNTIEELNDFVSNEVLKWRVIERKGDYKTEENQGRIYFANSLWYNSSEKKSDKNIFSENYQNIAQNVFHATANTVTSATAVETINQWVEKATEGMLSKIIENSDFETALINTTYFKCSWQNEFEQQNTKKDIFHNIDNTQSEIDFMNGENYAYYSEVDDWQALALPYSDNKYKMYLFMPKQGNIQQLDYETLNKLLLFKENTKVKITMPKFTIESSYDLKPVLQNMGITAMFQNNEDFNNMYDNSKGKCITDALQKTKMIVNEKGTESASGTVIVTRGIHITEPTIFKADRPFIYMITKTSGNEEVLFIGQYVTAKE